MSDPLPASERVAILSGRMESIRSRMRRYGKRYNLLNQLLATEEALAKAEEDLRREKRWIATDCLFRGPS